jgi:hypothetical protein
MSGIELVSGDSVVIVISSDDSFGASDEGLGLGVVEVVFVVALFVVVVVVVVVVVGDGIQFCPGLAVVVNFEGSGTVTI